MKKNIVKGYKVFNPDWTCKDFKYKVGGEYKMDEDISLCRRGFHFCEELVDCFEYYPFDSKNKVAVVEALGIVQKEENGNKSVTNHIRIGRELSWFEVCDLVNTGKNNTGINNSGNRNSGYRNSGYYNSGNYNSGNRNSGYRNSGDYNSGNYNSGNRNSGDYNSGYYNSGNYNSGNRNSGDYNSGYCNSGDCNSGIFNSQTSNMSLFNTQTKYTFKDLEEKYEVAINAIIYSEFPLTKWISAENMTKKEKKENPQWETLGGYLKQNTYKESWAIAWENMRKEERIAIQELPNFDKKIFKEITGITIGKEK